WFARSIAARTDFGWRRRSPALPAFRTTLPETLAGQQFGIVISGGKESNDGPAKLLARRGTGNNCPRGRHGMVEVVVGQSLRSSCGPSALHLARATAEGCRGNAQESLRDRIQGSGSLRLLWQDGETVCPASQGQRSRGAKRPL